ncbi:hypothetical protein ACWDZW_39795, partial [Streptomyces coeruleorubidus]
MVRARDADRSGPGTPVGPRPGAGRRAPSSCSAGVRCPGGPLPPLPRLRRERRAGPGILRPRRNWVAVPVVRSAAQAGPARP